ncbi:hypothetical protein [Parapedobacter sp. 10938]|uniref:hypothetical protein n=1 Tax=Parapedobacter flavus TaxID=3110225 RepID=UPI002DBC6A1C|nr:hypothetical protein [Parapedobacter sp. 10938]MEC3879457.1 hypothetical protein [Parapedobacter sp. 10938]
MKINQTRRKFIATAVSGVAGAAVAPMALATEKPGPSKESALGTQGAPAPKPVPPTGERVDPSEFIIFPWGRMPHAPAEGAWGDIVDMDAMMNDLYHCGFNTSGFTDAKYLKYVRNNHLAGILYAGIDATKKNTQSEADEKIRTFLASITDPEDRKAVHAIYLRDEPNAALFPQLNTWSEAVKKQGILPYINLFPDYAPPALLGTADYEAHLDSYVETCTPPYISYDNYSLLEGGRLDEDRFFGNIEAVRKKSLQVGIPFWNVILANGHFNYAEPSEATLAVQVYATLAYGGKGIGYFTYYTPQVGNYRLAPIDRFGYRTKTWEMMRHVNLQIHSLAPVYGKLKSVNVFHADRVPRNGQGAESAKLVESISGTSLLVGEFLHPDGKPYALVVNKNMQSSVTFDVQFKEKGRTMLVSQFDQGRVPFTGEQKWLAPGCGALLTVE